MPQEMRHTAGGRCRRQVWRRKTSRGAEDASEGGRCIGRWRRRRKQKQSSRWKGVAEGGSPYNDDCTTFTSYPCLLPEAGQFIGNEDRFLAS